MSEIIKTEHDGWDCVPELKEAVEAYEEAADIVYEINNCVRDHDLSDIIDKFRNMCQTIEDVLDNIDEDQEFETVDEEDEE